MTLANAPLSARDVRINASDLPDALSEIFFAEWLDTPQLRGELICPSGNAAALSMRLERSSRLSRRSFRGTPATHLAKIQPLGMPGCRIYRFHAKTIPSL